MNKKGFLIVAAVLFPLSIYAADNPTSQDTTQEMFNKLDSNHDGYISQQEAKADKKLTDDWSQVDKNKNGEIDESEFSAFEESQQPQQMPKSSEEPSSGSGSSD